MEVNYYKQFETEYDLINVLIKYPQKLFIKEFDKNEILSLYQNHSFVSNFLINTLENEKKIMFKKLFYYDNDYENFVEKDFKEDVYSNKCYEISNTLNDFLLLSFFMFDYIKDCYNDCRYEKMTEYIEKYIKLFDLINSFTNFSTNSC